MFDLILSVIWWIMLGSYGLLVLILFIGWIGNKFDIIPCAKCGRPMRWENLPNGGNIRVHINTGLWFC